MSRPTLILFLILILLTGCVDPFDAPRGNYDQLLVVEAFISDDDSPQYVYLSVSYPIDSNNYQTVDNASVRISDDLGGSYMLTPMGEGTYVTDPAVFRPETGRKYTLSVDIGNDRNYISDEVTMKSTPAIEDLYFEETNLVTEDGIVGGFNIMVDANGTPGITNYMRYEWEETYKTVAPFPSLYEWDKQSESIILRTEQITECWLDNISTSVILATTEGLNTSDIQRKVVHTLRFDMPELNDRYSILVKQFALNQESYEFWKNLQETSELGGGLFDTQPFPLTGNIRNTRDAREPVLGYFDMSQVSASRIFIDYLDLPGDSRAPSLFAECNSSPGDIIANADTVWFYDQQGYLISSYEFPIGYIMVPQRCIDCRVKGTNVKPEFWVD